MRLRSAHILVRAFAASSVLLACSVKVGSNSGAGKPAGPADAAAPTSSGKAVASSAPSESEPESEPEPEPAPAEDPASGPVRTPADEGPTRTSGEPQRVAGDPDQAGAVCDNDDEVLRSLCHRALDPIAADDVDAFVATLADDVVLVRPGPDGRAERATGKTRVHREIRAAGGLAKFLHVRPGTRVVGTVMRDCRRCAKSYVAVQANTTSGRIIVTTDSASPPRVTQLELRADPRTREKGAG